MEKFGRRDVVFVLVCVVVGALCLWYCLANFQRAFPEASIRFDDTRADSRARAESLLEEIGTLPGDRRYAGIFSYQGQAKVYLEKELGLDRANEIMGTEVLLWKWAHRWFRPLEKEEIRLQLATTGELVGFAHVIEEDAPGADLSQEEARALAMAFLERWKGLEMSGLEFIEASTEDRPRRTDHTFVWEREGWKAGDATYRYRVTIQGDEAGGYGEFLKVPEAWTRDYQRLRSWNEMAGVAASLGIILTVVAMVVIVILRARRRDLRWKTALLWGAVGAVLSFLTFWNDFATDLYSYDTTDTWSGFLLWNLFLSVGGAFGVGLLVTSVVVAGEAMYRERFGRFLSASKLFTPRGMRTKRFFRGVVLGLVLTPFFIAYQVVFYLLATRFGAWSPADVPFDNILNSRFPWVLVLFIGFLPAVSEEFMSRAFSVPFFEKISRSRIVAVIVPAFIWGFGHSAYPNQPFWIRGVEVGLVGVLVGVLLYRYGLLPLLVWHYTVDAAYTALLLFRSGNTYFITSAAIGVGLLLLPLVLSLLFYAVKGGFLPDSGLTNEDEGVAPLPDRPERPVEPVVAYMPHTRQKATALAVMAVVGIALFAVPVPEPGSFVRFPMTGGEAEAIAREFLLAKGFQIEGTRVARSTAKAALPGDGAEYLLRSGGIETLDRVARDELKSALWRVRFFRPGEKQEWTVMVDPRTGRAVEFYWTQAEDAPGADLGEEEALAVAVRAAEDLGFPLSTWDLKDSSSEKMKARRDHYLVWENPEADGMGEARVRVSAEVQGDRAGRVGAWLWLPEDWERESRERTLLSAIVTGASIAVPVLLLLAGFVFLGRLVAKGGLSWRWVGITSIVLFLPAGVRNLLLLAQMGLDYDTSVPWEVHAGRMLMVAAMGIIVVGMGIGLGALVVSGLFPAFRLAMRRQDRRVLARDAILGGAVALAAGALLVRMESLVTALLPDQAVLGAFPVPDYLHLPVPGLAQIGTVAVDFAGAGALLAILLALWTRLLKPIWARAILVVVLIPFLMQADATRPGEMLADLAGAIVALALIWLVGRFVLRDNPLAWGLAILLGMGVPAAVLMIRQMHPWFVINGALVLAALLAPVVWLLLSMRGSSRQPEAVAHTEGEA